VVWSTQPVGLSSLRPRCSLHSPGLQYVATSTSCDVRQYACTARGCVPTSTISRSDAGGDRRCDRFTVSVCQRSEIRLRTGRAHTVANSAIVKIGAQPSAAGITTARPPIGRAWRPEDHSRLRRSCRSAWWANGLCHILASRTRQWRRNLPRLHALHWQAIAAGPARGAVQFRGPACRKRRVSPPRGRRRGDPKLRRAPRELVHVS
jgi:hypothetical protein